MDGKKQSLPLENLPFDLEAELGEIREAEQLCPGVYMLSVRDEEAAFGQDYFAVMEDTPVISPEVKSYGKRLPEFPRVLLYSTEQPDSGWMLVRYEWYRYQSRNKFSLPEYETLQSAAFLGREQHPEYFGEIPVPFSTIKGNTLRSKTLANGIYWIETDMCEEILAVAFPIWDDLSEAAQRLALNLDRSGSQEAVAAVPSPVYLLFSELASCVPLYELSELHPEWEQAGLIDSAALMNAVCERYPVYATAANMFEMAGANDMAGQLLSGFGLEIPLYRRPDRALHLSPDAGTDFLRFWRKG